MRAELKIDPRVEHLSRMRQWQPRTGDRVRDKKADAQRLKSEYYSQLVIWADLGVTAYTLPELEQVLTFKINNVLSKFQLEQVEQILHNMIDIRKDILQLAEENPDKFLKWDSDNSAHKNAIRTYEEALVRVKNKLSMDSLVVKKTNSEGSTEWEFK